MDLIKRIIAEAEAYSNISDIEKLVESGAALTNVPVQPLYSAFKSLTPENCAEYLKKLTTDQRSAMLDIDLWNKDNLDIENFHFWFNSYSVADEDLRYEFVKSSEFALYLKGKISIWTFDLDDPQYPDHDNYFLTEDNQLLFEFEDDYEYVEEIQNFIKDLYSDLGVDEAYVYLFKIVSDTFSNMSEEEYRLKNNRLSDYGFVDYYDSLKMVTPYPNIDVLDNKIKNQITLTAEIDNLSAGQSLHQMALSAYKEKLNPLADEISKVKDEQRLKYLQFNFIRLVNGTLTFDDALKSGSVAMNQTGNKTKSLLLLGFNYIVSLVGTDDNISLFEKFDFTEVFKCGMTLIRSRQKEIKSALRGTLFEDDDSFLGPYWSDFLEESFNNPVKLARPYFTTEEIIKVEDFNLWSNLIQTFTQMLPFANQFAVTFFKLKESGQLRDEYYLNYKVDDIDFETILLSSLANFTLGNFKKNENQSKMGLTIEEFKTFIAHFINENDEIQMTEKSRSLITDFIKSFALDSIFQFDSFIEYLIQNHLDGYEYSKLKESEYHHVGGPIILNQH